jgi:hypothetical protein
LRSAQLGEEQRWQGVEVRGSWEGGLESIQIRQVVMQVRSEVEGVRGRDETAIGRDATANNVTSHAACRVAAFVPGKSLNPDHTARVSNNP